MSDTTSLRLLLVDDHLIVRRGLASLLDDEDDLTVVAEAGSGEEAIALTKEHKPDVVVLDYSMPGQKGDATLEELRRSLPDLPVVLVSGYNDLAERCDFNGGSGVSFLPKPFQRDELIGAVQSALKKP